MQLQDRRVFVTGCSKACQGQGSLIQQEVLLTMSSSHPPHNLAPPSLDTLSLPTGQSRPLVAVELLGLSLSERLSLIYQASQLSRRELQKKVAV